MWLWNVEEPRIEVAPKEKEDGAQWSGTPQCFGILKLSFLHHLQ